MSLPVMNPPSGPIKSAATFATSSGVPGPDGKPYPALAQHAMREARVLAENIHRVLNDRSPKPFIHDTLGMMGSLGHNAGFGQFLKVRLHVFPA